MAGTASCRSICVLLVFQSKKNFMTIKKKKPIFFFIFEAHLESCNYTLSMKCKQKLSVFFLPARWNIDVRVSTTAAILD